MIGNKIKNFLKRKIDKDERGTTLLELVAAVSIFVLLTTLANGIYINIVKSQRQTIAAQLTQESLRFVFEMMSKEIRTAQGLSEGSDCASTSPFVMPSQPGYYKIFNNFNNNSATTTSALYFKNKNGQCVVYDLDNNRIRIKRASSTSESIVNYITPDELKVTNLKFLINDVKANNVRSFQANVTILVDAEMNYGPLQNIKMQTTVSSREYSF